MARFEGWGRRWPAPAKLNLGLHILGRRADGYHELQTVFQFTDWSDGLWLRVRSDGRIRRVAGPAAIPEADDLAVRAARRLQQAGGRALGADIVLRKCIPVGSGLGGGSSDAATTLLALDALWGLDLGRTALAEIGLGLGADVPVFVQGHAAFAQGRGEVLTPVNPPERWYVILNPRVEVSTGEVFAHPKLTRATPPQTIRGFLAGSVRNDCTAAVCALHPAVAEALAWLSRHGPAQLSGTGGCVYVPVSSRAAGRALCAEVPLPWRARLVRGVNRHPLAAPDAAPCRIGR
jgi:4-diphosphocytidyl-2-C-methyl-D-erythritol kinase